MRHSAIRRGKVRSGEQSYFSAGTGIDTLQKQPSGHGHGKKYDSQSCGKWYISIQTEYEESTPVRPSTSRGGLDAGVAKPATLSDGTVFAPVNNFQKNQEEPGRLQRQLSHRGKFNSATTGRNRNTKYSNCIPVSQLSVGTTFIKSQRPSGKNYAISVIEDLKVKNMSKSAVEPAEPACGGIMQSGCLLKQGATSFRARSWR